MQRLTRQRQAIFDNLKSRFDHPTAEQIYGSLKDDMPALSLGTVYRNLEELTKHQMIKKITIHGRKARYDGAIEAHDHVHCLSCDQLFDLPKINLDFAAHGNEHLKLYEIKDLELVVKAICPTCISKNQLEGEN